MACAELCDYASRMKGYFALETGPETAAHLRAFLDTLGGRGVAVNFDPANMVMVTGDDPVQGVHLLKDYIVHTHVKDGIRYQPVDPRDVYGAIGYQPLDHQRIAELVSSGAIFQEVPLGEGKVDFDAYFRRLAGDRIRGVSDHRARSGGCAREGYRAGGLLHPQIQVTADGRTKSRGSRLRTEGNEPWKENWKP